MPPRPLRARHAVVALALLTAGGVAAHPPELGHTPKPDPSANQVRVRVTPVYRYFESNGLPDHATGAFPGDHIPYPIRAQRYRYRVPIAPRHAAVPVPLGDRPFGIALNGVPFDPTTPEAWLSDPSLGWTLEPMGERVNLGLDAHRAHVHSTGAYHYHGPPATQTHAGMPARVRHLGWAADGYPIYGPKGYADPDNPRSAVVSLRSSYRLRTGVRPSGIDGPGGPFDGMYLQDWVYEAGLGDLDECNGRFGVTPEFPRGTYHYVLTESFPGVPRQFRGVPDASFAQRGTPMPGAKPARMLPPPPEGPSR